MSIALAIPISNNPTTKPASSRSPLSSLVKAIRSGKIKATINRKYFSRCFLFITVPFYDSSGNITLFEAGSSLILIVKTGRSVLCNKFSETLPEIN